MKKTPLFSAHEKLGAKLVDFAGYKMPIQYNSIIAEHKATRESAGVFDVSHMGEIFIKGRKALDFIQKITINDASKLTVGKIQYSAMCYEDGGIVDDLLVYKLSEDEFMLVVNASNKDKDLDWMNKNNDLGVKITDLSDNYALIALQGPNSRNILQKICYKELDIEYYTFFEAKIDGVPALVSRTGYTGELGFEIYIKGTENDSLKVWNSIFEAGKDFGVYPVGLGARDTLRLEMGFCLYGNDIDQTTNPLEAGLGWITKLSKSDFIGKEAILRIKNDGLKRKLMPISSEDKIFPRKGCELTVDGKKVGVVTSGAVSPIINKAIALGYVNIDNCLNGAKINFSIRGKEYPGEFVSLPFIKKT